MPDCLKSTTTCLYADDTEIFSSYDFTELIGNLNSDLNHIRNWLVKNKLQHHPTKSKFMFTGSCNLNNKVCDNSI